MPVSLFQNSHGFREINSHTHSVRSPDISAPALTWHTAYWIADQYDLNFEKLSRHNFVKSELDRIIGSTLRCLRATTSFVSNISAIPRDSGKVILFRSLVDEQTYDIVHSNDPTKRQLDILDSDSRAITIGFQNEGIGYRLRFELHTEYFTVTIIAELIGPGSDEAQKLNTALILLRYLVGSGGKLDWDLQEALNIYVFNDFWKNFFRFLEFDCSLGPVYDDAIFRLIFGDFRGLILSEQHVSRLRTVPDSDPHLAGWGKPVADSVLEFMSYKKRYEATASYVLDGRGLYVTALGPQLGKDYDNTRSPVTFFVCAKQRKDRTGHSLVNNDQLGRLVSTFHLLGTLRVAALRDLRSLRIAGSLLGRFEPLARSAQGRLQDNARDPERSVDLQSVMSGVYDNFAKIGDTLVPRIIDNSKTERAAKNIEDVIAPSGLQYRVERSRYYVSEFERNVRYIRLVRVEGFQTYDEFVERRLRPAYEYINRLGVRYERAISALSLIEQNYLALRADKTERDLREIQTYGESILLLILVPYYLIATFHHVAHEKAKVAQFGYIFTSALLVAIAATRATKTEKRRLLIPWDVGGISERLDTYQKGRRRVVRNILAHSLLSTNVGRKSFRRFSRSHRVIRLLHALDQGRILIGNGASLALRTITVQGILAFCLIILTWYWVVLPVVEPHHPSPSSPPDPTMPGHRDATRP